MKKKEFCDENEYAKSQKSNDDFAQKKIDNFTNLTKVILQNLFEINFESKSEKNMNNHELKYTNKKIQKSSYIFEKSEFDDALKRSNE